MKNWKDSLKNGLNVVVEKGVDGINMASDYMERHPETAKAMANAVNGVSQAAVAGIGIAGREITKDQILSTIGKCGKSGAAGAAIDGVLGAREGAKLYYEGIIDKRVFADHLTREVGCGFVSSTAGTAGTTVVSLITGSMGPAALLAGMGASVGSRYLYRNLVKTVLPDLEDVEEEENEEDLEEILGEIDAVWQHEK